MLFRYESVHVAFLWALWYIYLTVDVTISNWLQIADLKVSVDSAEKEKRLLLLKVARHWAIMSATWVGASTGKTNIFWTPYVSAFIYCTCPHWRVTLCPYAKKQSSLLSYYHPLALQLLFQRSVFYYVDLLFLATSATT